MKKVCFSVDLLVALAQLEDKDLAQMQRAIAYYANDGIVPGFSNAALKAFFTLFRSSIDEQRVAAEKQSKVNHDNAVSKNSPSKKKSSKGGATSAKKPAESASDVSEGNSEDSDCAVDVEDKSVHVDGHAYGSADSHGNTFHVSNSHEEPCCVSGSHNVNDSVSGSSDSHDADDYASDSQQVADAAVKSLTLDAIESIYPKLGTFRSESLALWEKFSDGKRQAAISYVPEYVRSHPSSMSQVYLNQYLKAEPWPNSEGLSGR